MGLGSDIDIAALKRGERGALDAFYRCFARVVLDRVRRLGGPSIDAEDVAHEVFIVAFRRLDTFRDDGSLRAWLFGVTRRVVANARRRAAIRRMVGLEQIAEPPSPGLSAEDEVGRLWRRQMVLAALDRLSVAHREVLVLVDFEDLSTAEAAETLGVSVGTVYSRLHYGRHGFAAALRKEVSVRTGVVPQGPLAWGDDL
jgi:RNA polymerase sigma-70 factor (ECF subfamily)